MAAKQYLMISGVLFALVAVLLLVRVLVGWPFVFGPWEIPISGSWVGFVLAGALALWAFRLGRR
jgi:hypothetical protein